MLSHNKADADVIDVRQNRVMSQVREEHGHAHSTGRKDLYSLLQTRE